jgi:hypothetical protein
MKSIVYYLPSKSVSKEEQLIDSCVSALRELFFHLSEEEYHLRRLAFADAVAEVFERNSSDILKVFPTFDVIRTQLYGSTADLLVESKVVTVASLPDGSELYKLSLFGHYISYNTTPFMTWFLSLSDPRRVPWLFAPLSFLLRLFFLIILSFLVPTFIYLLVTWPVGVPWTWLVIFGFVSPLPDPPEWIRGILVLSLGSPIAEEWFKDGFYPFHALLLFWSFGCMEWVGSAFRPF